MRITRKGLVNGSPKLLAVCIEQGTREQGRGTMRGHLPITVARRTAQETGEETVPIKQSVKGDSHYQRKRENSIPDKNNQANLPIMDTT